jgi:hypothetical protein
MYKAFFDQTQFYAEGIRLKVPPPPFLSLALVCVCILSFSYGVLVCCGLRACEMCTQQRVYSVCWSEQGTKYVAVSANPRY